MRLEQINKPIKERGMPSSIIKHKQKLAMMTDKELADRFKDADEDKLRRMAWGHGYGKMSSHYWDRVQNARTTGGFREEDPKPIMRDPLDSEQAKDMQRDKDRMIFHGKEIDQNSIQYEMQDYSDMIFELHMANYIDGTELDEKELEELEGTDELQEWVRIDYVSEDKVQEGFIGKKMEYTDFLQNKLDTAIQEYDTPEKKAERDALMKQYLNKGGSIEKVPAGQTAYKNKELKPAFKKNPGTPQTSPMSDESANKKQNYSDKEIRQAKGIAFDKRYKGGNYTGASNTINKLKKGLSDHPDVADALRRANEDEPGYYKNPDKEFNINGMTTKQDVVQSIIDNIDNNELDTAKDSLNQLLDVVTGLHEEGDAYAPARLIGACEASLSHGLEMAQNVINKKYSMAEVQAEVIVQNWPILLDKMKNVYQTNERVEDGVIMCPEACCGKPVTECKCDAECEHCNCFIIKAQENKSESQDGLQPADLKRLGQTEPKIYVHKDGKTIMIPKSKHNEYLAKGWKQSALRAETSYESKLTDMLNQRLK